MNSNRTARIAAACAALALSMAAPTLQADEAPRAAVVKFALTPDPAPRVVRLNNYCAAALQDRAAESSRRYCAAALNRMRSMPAAERPALERNAVAAIVSNAALMHYLAGERDQARMLIDEAARLAPEAGFVKQNHALLTAAAPQRLASK